MRPPNPRHRYDAINVLKRIPESDVERSLFVLLHGAEQLNSVTPLKPWTAESTVDPDLQYPLDLFKNLTARSILEAFLLATDNNVEIGKAIAMPVDEVAMYRHVFFDTAVFRTDLELMVYLRSIPEENEAKSLYRIAFHQGLGALRWHFCRDKGTVEPEEVLRTLMTDYYYRTLQHRGTPITSKVSKEAMRTAKVAMDCARAFMQRVDNTKVEDLRFKFEKVSDTRNFTEFSEPILH